MRSSSKILPYILTLPNKSLDAQENISNQHSLNCPILNPLEMLRSPSQNGAYDPFCSHFKFAYQPEKELTDTATDTNVHCRFEKIITETLMTKKYLFNPLLSLQNININKDKVKTPLKECKNFSKDMELEESPSVQALTWINSESFAHESNKVEDLSNCTNHKIIVSFPLEMTEPQSENKYTTRKRKRSSKDETCDEKTNSQVINASPKTSDELSTEDLSEKSMQKYPPMKKKGKKNRLQKANELFEDSLIRAEICLQDMLPLPTVPSHEDKYSNEDFANDLKEAEGDLRHQFMRKHFPLMYTKANYYKYIKQAKEKRELKPDNSMKNIQVGYFLNSMKPVEKPELPKKVWCPAGEFEDKKYEAYLQRIENIWPFEIAKFNREHALEFLMLNDYSEEVVYRKITESEEFRGYLQSKETNFQCDEGIVLMKHGSKKGPVRHRNYMLRNNNQNARKLLCL